MQTNEVEFTLTEPDAKAPTRAYELDAGNDLYALDDEEIKPGETIKIRTGVSVAVPEGHQGIIKDRSSMGVKGLHVFAGVVDFGFSGELSVVMHNSNVWITPSFVKKVITNILSFKTLFDKKSLVQDLFDKIDEEYTNKSYFVKKGDKIAQLIISPISVTFWTKVDKLKETKRGTNGFGSSGSK